MFRSSLHLSLGIRLAALLLGLVKVRAEDVTVPATPHSLSDLLALPPASLRSEDVAIANMLCAQSLPGAEGMDISSSLALIDTMARRVQEETDRLRPRYWQNPAEYYSSEAYFKMLVLVTVVQQDFNIHYNPARITSPDKPEPADTFFADAADIFINGALGPRRTGTCSSLPVFYAAIGRRLGYPLKLVTAKAHLFVRWDDEQARINLEGSGRGLAVFPDEHYRQWPYPISTEEEKRDHYLQNLTPAEEVAIFLQARSQVLLAHKNFAGARAALQQAATFAPNWPHVDGLISRDIDLAQYGAPKPMLIDRERPRIVGPAASTMANVLEMQQASQDARARYERSRRENPSLPVPPQPGAQPFSLPPSPSPYHIP